MLTKNCGLKNQVISFSHYLFKLTLRHQGEDVSEAEKYVGLDGEWLVRLFCDLLMERQKLRS